MSKYERFLVYPLVFLALFASLTGVNLVSAGREVLHQLIVRELIVVDEQGRTLCILGSGSQEEDASLRLFNHKGEEVLALKAYPMGGYVDVKKEGLPVLLFSAHPEGGIIGLLNKEQTLLASIVGTPMGGLLTLQDASEEPKVLLGVDDTSSGMLALTDKHELGGVVLFAREPGGQVHLFSKAGNEAGSFQVQAQGGGTLVLHDGERETPMVRVGASLTGAFAVFLGEDGEPFFTLGKE